MTPTSPSTNLQVTDTPNPTAEQRDSNVRNKEQARSTTQDFSELGECVKDSVEEKLGNLKETASEYLAQGQR